MADSSLPPELQQLAVLQRQTLASVSRIADAAAAPRRVRIVRDGRGAITGAVSEMIDREDAGEETQPNEEME